MKKILLFLAMLAIATMATAQIKVTTAGNVGIGFNAPTFKLDARGTVRFGNGTGTWEAIRIDWNNTWGAAQLYCTTDNFTVGTSTYPASGTFRHLYYYQLHNLSDSRLKTNISSLSHSLAKIMQVNGRAYNYIDNSREMRIEPLKEQNTKLTFGFIAQELMEVFPELVTEPDDFCEHYTVNYIGMIPVLVEALKEQQVAIETLQNIATAQELEIIQLQKLRYSVMELQEVAYNCCEQYKGMAPLPVEEPQPLEGEPILYQNTPNPFTSNTEISYYLPELTTQAVLYIFNLQGIELQSHLLIETGLHSVTIFGSALPAGMYLYTLVVDNVIIDTKRMILTK